MQVQKVLSVQVLKVLSVQVSVQVLLGVGLLEGAGPKKAIEES